MGGPSEAWGRPESGLTVPARELRLLIEGIRSWSARAGGAEAEGALGLLVGEPGTGKSLLVAALCAELRSRSILVSRATFYRGEAPLAPIRQLLGGLLADLLTVHGGEASRAALAPEALDPHLPELCRLLPDFPWPRLATPLPSLGPPLDRLRTCDAVAQTFLLAARAAPLILVIENLQWADPASRSVLAAILRAARFNIGESARILVVGTLRPEEKSGLEEILDPRFLAFQVEVRGLSRNELQDSATSLGHDLPLTTREALQRATGGNLLHLNFFLRGFGRGEEVALLPPGAEAVPPGECLRQLVGERYRRLDEAQRRTLEVLAALGRPVDPEMMALLFPDRSGQLKSTLARLEEGGWLKSMGPGEGWEVAGEPIAAAVLGLLPPAGRASLETQVAEALLASISTRPQADRFAEPASPSRVFHHLRQAPSHPRLVEVGLRAAREADAFGDDEQAIDVRERLMSALDPARDRQLFLEVGQSLASILERQGLHQEAIDAYRALAAVPDLPLEARAAHARKIGSLHERLGELGEAARSYGQGLEALQGAGDCAERLKLCASQARLSLEMGDDETCLQHFRECLAVLPGAKIGEGDRLEVLRLAEEVAYLRKDYAEALSLEDQIFESISDLSDFSTSLEAIGHLAQLHSLRGNLEGASRILQEALGLARQTGSRLLIARFLSRLGHVLRSSGDIRGALEHLTRAGALYLELGNEDGREDLHLTLAQLHLQVFEVKEAVSAIREYLRMLPFRGARKPERSVFSPVMHVPSDRDQAIQRLRAKIAEKPGAVRQGGLYAELADLLVEQGEHEEASRLYESALRSSYAAGSPLSVAQLFQRAARLWRILGNRARALQFYERSLDFLGPVPEKDLVGTAYLEVGSILLTQGDPGRSYDYLLKAFRIFHELEDDLGLVATFIRLSEFLHAIGLRSLSLSLIRGTADLGLQVKLGCLEADAHRLRGALASECGEFAESARSFARARQALEVPRLFSDRAKLQLEVGWASYRQGDNAAAEKVARLGLDLARKLGMQDALEEFLFLFGVVESALSNRSRNFLRALELLNQALLGAQGRGRPLLEAKVLEAISRNYRERGKEDLASEYHGRSLAIRESFISHLPPPLLELSREELSPLALNTP